MSRVRQFKEWLLCYDNNFNVSPGDFSGNEGRISEDEMIPMKDGCGESSRVITREVVSSMGIVKGVGGRVTVTWSLGTAAAVDPQ